MIKAFLFDYEGVITAGVIDGVPAARLAHNLAISESAAGALIKNIWDEYSTGKLTDAAAWATIEAEYGQPISLDQRDIWYTWDELRPLPEMIELVAFLKSRGYPVGLVSNVLPPTAQIIGAHGGYDAFDFCMLSCQVGARKPDPKIYQAALANLPGLRPPEVVFLDDRVPCITGAAELGIATIHVTDHSRAIQQIHGLIV